MSSNIVRWAAFTIMWVALCSTVASVTSSFFAHETAIMTAPPESDPQPKSVTGPVRIDCHAGYCTYTQLKP